MGGFGIWAMHFVGNRAVVLEYGAPARQMLYNPGYTALSFFMPILVLVLAFYTLGVTKRARQLHVAIASCLTGAAVCGMHYLGQLGIENYHCSYKVGNVVGAAVISVFASFVALSVFFRLREKWTDTWWKRGSCGVALALAVSGMHWTAAIGTEYRWKGNLSIHGSSRNITSIIASTLSIASCLVLLVIAFIRGRNLMAAKHKAQRLVLACAYFDAEGRIMVTQEGVLPSQKITNHYVERKFGDDDLGRSHSTFVWIYRASRHWSTIREYIPGMADYLEKDPIARQYRPSQTHPNISDNLTENAMNFAPIFKQLFCVAAQQLATLIHEPLERVGVLFEEPLETGATPIAGTQGKGNKTPVSDTFEYGSDAEGGARPMTVAKGKYLFLNRRLTEAETAKFAALGYRFGSVSQLSETLAKNMQTSRERLVKRFERMDLGTTEKSLPPPGVHLACFMLRPSVYKSFDVLVEKGRQSQLPYTTIQSHQFSNQQMYQLRHYDDMAVSEVMTALANRASGGQLQDDMRWSLYNAFVKLVDMIGDPSTMMGAKFSVKEFRVRCRRSLQTEMTSCTLLTVRVLRDIHATSATKDLTYVPLSFFSAQQHELDIGHTDEEFAEVMLDEFGHLARGGIRKRTISSSIHNFRRSNSTASTVHDNESSRSALFKNHLSVLKSPRRRSDEATMVDHEKNGNDVELTTTPTSESSGGYDGRSGVLQTGMLDIEPTGQDRSTWVTEAFGLFGLRPEGWSSIKMGGWKWDITVENSYEVGREGKGGGAHV
ncbi:hypothetical protein B0A52_02005 [Exophiala mesophila]|uniref:MHYT domain-containing protein n=1 Tax=Exophiala mesophila TaxID=212818 RepID=A0A438NEL1_EXOME|nr:hypothetical protein B0A52_02005 [Exophiala mesophila]